MIKTIAVIDIGTNSIKFCIAKKNNGFITPIIDSVYVTRMGENFLQTGKISQSAMERNLKIIHDLCYQSWQSGVSEIKAIGTMILRHAANADIFIQKVQSQCGIRIHVLSGEDEARLSYLAALSSLDDISGDICVLDTGGGSTELTFGKDQSILKNLSFNIGAVILTETYCMHDPVTHRDIDLMYDHIQKTINLNDTLKSVNDLIGSCGAITTMAAVKYQMHDYDSNVIHGVRLTRKDIQKQIKLFASKTICQRKQIPGIQKGREDIVLAGACIVEYIMSQLLCDQIIVCDRGIRYGIIGYYEHFKATQA
jgi:exopolyphosphatase/guanosine-5'-triphosphate,3'-diphosphate pyrophosphatase